ncbi:MAG: ABC transporter substrate-binding protein, partial [Thaumarchaeota archaeon]|nr:ABC transporter substrate-binding protein [Nitrososphaerota archaeon]
MRQHSRVSISTVVAVIVVVVIIVVAAGAYVLLTNTQPSTSTNTQASTTDTNTQSSTSLSNANIVLGTLPTADNVPLFIADQEGYFAQQGINLTIKFMAGGAVIAPAVQQGSIQIGLSSVTPLMSAVEQGFNFKFIAPIDAYDFPNSSQLTTYVPGFSTHALTVLTSSNITTWKDLSGKTIAESTLGSAAVSFAT